MYTVKQINSLIPFVHSHMAEYAPVWSKEQVEPYLNQHNVYGTLIAFFDSDNKPISMVRFNIEDDTAYILDAIVAPEHRKKNLLKLMANIGYIRFPFVKHIKFQDHETPDTEYKILPIEQRLLTEEQTA